MLDFIFKITFKYYDEKILIAVRCLIIFLPVISFADDLFFSKINYKKVYCGNEEFLGNPGPKRPHLHCGKSFLSYKKANGDHINLSEIDNCHRTVLVLENIEENKIAFANYQAINKAVKLYQNTSCPNQ